MQFRQPEQVPVVLPHDSLSSLFLDTLSSHVSDLPSSGDLPSSKRFQGCPNDISQEFRELVEDKSIDSFYEQNLFEYERGITPPVVKCRLRHIFSFGLILGHLPGC